MSKSGISTGGMLRTIMLSSPDIADKVTDIFPCVGMEDSKLPYIQYQCVGLDPAYVKHTYGVDKMLYDVTIYSAEFDEGLAIAEAVREVTTDVRCSDGGLYVSGIKVVNYANRWAGDSYEHTLRLQVTTNSLNDNIKNA